MAKRNKSKPKKTGKSKFPKKTKANKQPTQQSATAEPEPQKEEEKKPTRKEKFTNNVEELEEGSAQLSKYLDVTSVLSDIIATSREMETLRDVLKSVEGSAAAAGDRFEYLKSFSNKIGADLKGTAEGYVTIAKAAEGTALAGQQTTNIFESVATAGSVLGLSADDTNKVFETLGETIMKGNVDVDDLKIKMNQIPGAFDIAARAMNMTTGDLQQFAEEGKLTADEFLPAFASQLNVEFAGGIDEAANSLNGSINRMNNDFLTMQDSLGQELQPVMIGAIGVLRDMISFVTEHSDIFGPLLAGLAAASGAIGILTGVTWALNTALWANPLTWVVAGIAALTAGIVWAYNKFEPFRKLVNEVGDALGRVFDWMTGADPVADKIQAEKDKINASVKGAFDKGELYQYFKDLGEKHGSGYVDNLLKQYKISAQFLDKMNPSWNGAAMARYNEIVKQVKTVPEKDDKSKDKKKTASAKSVSKVDNVRGNNPVTINITINDGLVKTINLTTNNFKEGVSRMKDEVAEALTGVVRDSQLIIS